MNVKFPKENAPIKLYRHPLSGHCHRVQLMMSLLDIPYETIDLDMDNGAHKTPSYLKISPFGQVPAIDDNGITLTDSNAIIIYLEKKYNNDYEWYPQDPVQAAEVQRWLSVAAGEIAYGPNAARLAKVFGANIDYEIAQRKTYTLFTVLERILNTRNYLAGNTITVADVAGYSYISLAPEGDISLESYPGIRAWLERIESQPRFIGTQRAPLSTI
ncbi:glutathione S-transferase [Saccharophagus degradans]|uniref:glutathione S-transferase family protein n=1 Tax=Saccharophagus degradans TaxID=86304 RepID=UPI001C0913F8|nr:glutathione S-transferase [Saccharophagus degradans]MBU2986275.1 glutathione S-transferase [Saccharophagus degradans]